MTPPEEVGRWENFPFFHVSAVASHLAQAQDALSGAFAGAFVPEFTKVAKFGKVWSVALTCAFLRPSPPTQDGEKWQTMASPGGKEKQTNPRG